MTTFDFSPLFRSTVGFDRMTRLMESALSGDEGNGYPPYNIVKSGEDAYRIEMAVAGFSAADIEIESRENALTVSGKLPETVDQGRSYLHRGIAGRAFKRVFQLADHVRVDAARLENGLLQVDLVREIPEAMKPRRIEIASQPGPARIEQVAA